MMPADTMTVGMSRLRLSAKIDRQEKQRLARSRSVYACRRNPLDYRKPSCRRRDRWRVPRQLAKGIRYVANAGSFEIGYAEAFYGSDLNKSVSLGKSV